MILNSVWLIILTIQILNLRTKAFNYCLVHLPEYKKEKEKWHFCLLRGWDSFTNVSEMNNNLTIAILRHRTLIKINWTKQEQINETPKFWKNQIIYFFYGILRIILSKMRRLTSILSVRTPFFRKYVYHLCRSNFIKQNILNQNSTYHFIYLPI